MSLDDMTSTCPSCEQPLVPVLLHPASEPAGHPLSAEVPFVMRCPGCSSPDAP